MAAAISPSRERLASTSPGSVRSMSQFSQQVEDDDSEIGSADDDVERHSVNMDDASIQSAYRPFLHISVRQLVVGFTPVADTTLRQDGGWSLFGKHVSSLLVHAEDRRFLATFVENQVGFASIWAKRDATAADGDGTRCGGQR
jgi:hypothetical protein